MDDPQLFAPWFKKRWLRADSWATWRVFLKALYALPMDGAELETFCRHTGRTRPPTEPFEKCWLICGRRSGKSRIAALVASYNSVFRQYETLQRGEYGVMPIVASDKKQADVIFSYVANFFHDIPLLAKMVVNETKDSLELNNSIHIEVHASDYRSTRGYSMIGGICDELAFWRTDSAAASPDSEILNAIEKGSANIPGAMLLGVSSPYARAGVLFEAHEKNFDKDTDELCWVADTRSMNPTISQKIIDRAYAKDPASASAEYGAQFRSDLANFLTPEAIALCTDGGVAERAPREGVHYFGFVDPSGGAHDSMTLGISHSDNGDAVLDFLCERRPPFSPDDVVAEFCRHLKRYRMHSINGDNYGGDWPKERFQAHGVTYNLAEKNRSEIYLTFLPGINSARVRLLDNARLREQLEGLVRRTRSGGKDQVDHRAGAFDDLCNSACGALVLAGAGEVLLGLVEYFKGLFTGKYKMPEPMPAPRPQLKVEPEITTLKPMETLVETLPPCPQCKEAVCIQRIGQQWRCGQCAAQWWADNAIKPDPPITRGDLLGRAKNFYRPV
jgi:hypothetical protein